MYTSDADTLFQVLQPFHTLQGIGHATITIPTCTYPRAQLPLTTYHVLVPTCKIMEGKGKPTIAQAKKRYDEHTKLWKDRYRDPALKQRVKEARRASA